MYCTLQLEPTRLSFIADAHRVFEPCCGQGNTVERRALISATSVGGTCFILVAGSLATRYKKLKPELEEVQTSFRAIASRAV